MENKRILFAEASDGEIKAGWRFRTKKHEKIRKISRNDLRAFALRNYSEGYKINKPFSGFLVYRRIVPSAERLSSKFHSCPRSLATRPTVHFPDNLSALGIILYYTITKSMYAFWLVNQLWFIVPVNPWKNRASSELLYKSNRPQVSIQRIEILYRIFVNHEPAARDLQILHEFYQHPAWFISL